MRVVGGIKKGRRLASFKGLFIRPTSDKVREAIFNILPAGFPFKKALDLFAGTGAMGIEALSRGAGEAVFVDNDPRAVSIIRKNLDACGFTEARVLKRDVPGSIRLLSRGGEKFDIIFIDPPYESALIEETLRAIAEEGILAGGGFIVAESSKRAPVTSAPPGLLQVDGRRYGDTLVYFFTAADDI